MKIPNAFIHPHFYKSDDSMVFSKFDAHDILDVPFKYDIAYSVGAAPETLPWEQNHDSVPLLFLAWRGQEGKLIVLHEDRNRLHAKSLMIPAISWFMQALFWINGQPVRGLKEWKQEVASLQFKPVNVEERLDFVIKKPEMYHSFIQLQQLFSEHSKLYYKLKAIHKKQAT